MDGRIVLKALGEKSERLLIATIFGAELDSDSILRLIKCLTTCVILASSQP
jgi:hypothetical protein